MPKWIGVALGLLCLLGLLAGAWLAWAFQRDMAPAYARLAGRSTLLSTRLGDIEYTLRGSGPPVLVVHGSGGGFDQAEFLADAVLGPGHRSITPSRFGYLRSTLPAGASFDDQAHAFALLLDHLARARQLALMGVDETVTAGMSPQQQALAQALLQLMNPVAPRAAGVRFDNQARMPNERIAGLPAPTLVVHARNDSLQRFAHAEFALRHIPGAELLAFERGGHLVAIVQQAAIRAQVARHLQAHP